MRIIVTRDRSSEPVAAFSLAGSWPLLAVVAVAVFAASVYFGARALAGYWAQSGHPVLAEVVRERLAENESERRALLRETVRLQNGAVADLQVRLWQLRQRAAIAAETLNLPPDLFAAGDSLLTGVGGDDIRPVLCEGFPEDDASGSGDNDTVGTGGDVFQNGGVFKNNNGASGGEDGKDADVFAAAADLGDSLSALESELSRTAAGLDAVERRAAGVAVLRRTIPMERPVAGSIGGLPYSAIARIRSPAVARFTAATITRRGWAFRWWRGRTGWWFTAGAWGTTARRFRFITAAACRLCTGI